MKILSRIYEKALNLQSVDAEEGEYLYNNASLAELMLVADRIRQIHIPGRNVGWIIDRNVNITNICFSQCSFCNFCRKKGSPEAYITSTDQYIRKIEELYLLGGDQLLLQGGMNPELGLDFYVTLFKTLKG
ncbi:MAG: dehypoxanthine futalosine cyclase, partial [Bacteroidales bacterium]|nr:dehypoxanthine futalosine cyclase [Bacteroidales bacterium]